MNLDPWTMYQLEEQDRQREARQRRLLRSLQGPGAVRRTAVRSGLLLARFARWLVRYGQAVEQAPPSWNVRTDQYR